MKSEIESKLQTLLLWSRRANIEGEDEKEQEEYKLLDSVSSKIYGNTFKLCKIPTQSFKKVKDLETKIQNMAKSAINYREVFFIVAIILCNQC